MVYRAGEVGEIFIARGSPGHILIVVITAVVTDDMGIKCYEYDGLRTETPEVGLFYLREPAYLFHQQYEWVGKVRDARDYRHAKQVHGGIVGTLP